MDTKQTIMVLYMYPRIVIYHLFNLALTASAFCLFVPLLHYQAATPLCYQQLTRFSTPTVCQTRQMPPPASTIVIIDNNFCYFLCQPSSVCGASQVLSAFGVVSLKIEKCFSVVSFFFFPSLASMFAQPQQTGKLPFNL